MTTGRTGLPVEVSLVTVPRTPAPLELSQGLAGSSPVCRVLLDLPRPDGLPDPAGLAALSPPGPTGDLTVPGLWKGGQYKLFARQPHLTFMVPPLLLVAELLLPPPPLLYVVAEVGVHDLPVQLGLGHALEVLEDFLLCLVEVFTGVLLLEEVLGRGGGVVAGQAGEAPESFGWL